MGIVSTSLIFLMLTANVIYCIENNPETHDNHNSTQKATDGELILPRQYGLVTFEDQKPGINDDRDQNANGVISFEEPAKKPFRFEDTDPGNYHLVDQNPTDQQSESIIPNQNAVSQNLDQSGYRLTFQNDNTIQTDQVKPVQKKRRRRRRRKPRQQLNGYGFGPSGGQGPLVPGQVPGLSGRPIYPGPLPGQLPVPGVDGQYQGQFPGQVYRRPPRRPSALSSITSALTSIARYDDLQCVPRLLCEVAGGRAPAGTSSGLMQSILNLQPLVTLLAAYNGVSASPLFVFGRAALLGMTSRDNPGNCGYAYPQCPTDTEKLVEYLNNHNGGFFRFFNQPQQQYGLEQNLEQFYNQLGGQGYGLQQPGLGQLPGPVGQNNGPGQYPGPLGPTTGPGQLPGPSGQNYGLHPGDFGLGQSPSGFGNPNYGDNPTGNAQGYLNPGVYQNYGIQKPGLYDGNKDGGVFPYETNKYGYYQNQYKNNEQDNLESNKIEKRIQNRPDITFVDNKYEESNSVPKWSFPSDSRLIEVADKSRFGRTVKFPHNEQTHYEQVNTENYKQEHISNIYTPLKTDLKKQAKGFNFPENQSNRQYIDYYDYPPHAMFDKTKFKLDENGFYEEIDDGDYFKDNNSIKQEDGVEIVYVLRGNGDPNNPEIVKLKAGQKVQ